jgi:hypothetical protein
MPETVKNVGANVQIRIYIEDKKLGRDFTQVTNWQWNKTYYEGDDEYLGPADVEPWQLPKGAEGSFTIEEANASYVGDIERARSDAERSGQKPKVVITETTINNDGSSSKTTFTKVVLKKKKNAPGKGEKITHEYNFRSAVPKEE